ncbi:nitroreductase [Bosea sp. (in: a-proteobacteria)]|jgi:nitroreductase|uniref:nitroreductase n=1 Tax=Bosea sp. (in: a-proteobacteria) TaxID=1871050 RepID=UPI0025BB1846|nr:nitroreductase [Bosea sp. (in: a-proteobacteria)]
MAEPATSVTVSEAIERRMSVRAFSDRPVAEGKVRDILDRARRSPSTGNLQPWHVYAVGGERLVALKRLIAEKLARDPAGEPLEFASYPSPLWEPLRARRAAAGRLRYEAFGFADKDGSGLSELLRRNFDFFGAPVGLFFYLDARVGPPQWADLGMFLQSLMLLAVEEGLDTCPQQVWGSWNATLRDFLGVPDGRTLFCGMSLGYRDASHPCIAARTERAAMSEFASFAW